MPTEYNSNNPKEISREQERRRKVRIVARRDKQQGVTTEPYDYKGAPIDNVTETEKETSNTVVGKTLVDNKKKNTKLLTMQKGG